MVDISSFFFFKQKTAYEIGTGDWSSDVCSSDLSSRISVKSDGGYGEMPPNSYNDRKDYGGTFPICRNNPHYNNGPGYGQEQGDGKFRYNHRRRRDLDLPQT